MDHATTRGRVLVGAAGWELVRHPAAADVIWVRNRCYLGDYEPARWSSDGGRRQAFNMLPWDLPVTDKGLLVKHLSAVSEYDASAFVPSTFRLTEPQQRQAFVSAMAACKRREEDDAQGGGGCGTWILKRTDLSNGEGEASRVGMRWQRRRRWQHHHLCGHPRGRVVAGAALHRAPPAAQRPQVRTPSIPTGGFPRAAAGLLPQWHGEAQRRALRARWSLGRRHRSHHQHAAAAAGGTPRRQRLRRAQPR
jgi:hypothetical protein